ncbi:hypothetical protein [Halorarius halobius]|uniref:hypothetical protein n=1 Tax=Halorarius halobius TaxID=2962671 RepID=UPI0020CF8FFA|nr:hypothetical protein [Halorarius halobius]
MSPFDRSSLYFAMVFVGACVMFAGAGGFLALHDQDWKYSYDCAEDAFPQNEGNVVYYDTLSPEERQSVDSALDGETLYFETEEPVPPTVVKKNGTFHVFDRFTVFDYYSEGTYGPIAVALVGMTLIVDGARRDVRR